MLSLKNKQILITGGTGSLGHVLVDHLLSGKTGRPARIIVFSRDEDKQFHMRMRYQDANGLSFRLGDVRDYPSVLEAMCDVDIIIHAAALKQVPACEYFPFESVMTNILGAQNVVRAARENGRVETVVGISTDKACKPVNVMGMTKALQERVILAANLDCPGTRFLMVRYGNVVGSRGSVVPLFRQQLSEGGPLTVTTPNMTRFLLTLDQAVDVVFEALQHGNPGETLVPRAPSARILDLARVMIGTRPVEIELTGIRPGEKTHEILISEEECYRTTERNGYYVIHSVLPELDGGPHIPVRDTEYSSAESLLSHADIQRILVESGFGMEGM